MSRTKTLVTLLLVGASHAFAQTQIPVDDPANLGFSCKGEHNRLAISFDHELR